MIKEKEIKITEEMLHGLFEGKKIVLAEPDLRITLYPPRYGVFMTYDKLIELKRTLGYQALRDTEGFFKEIFGNEMTENHYKWKKQ